MLLLTGFEASAQVSVKGKVIDSLGKPIPSVSISLKKNNGLILSYAITRTEGTYHLRNANANFRDTLLLEANAIGFDKQVFSLKDTLQEINITLHSSILLLPNVKVANTKPILKKEGDTLNYDVASFSTKQDRVIGDVIKKLPGVEVAENGQISYGGKPINRFYIDGENLLDGRYNIATNSVPTDAVAKIQVLENHQPIKAMKKLQKSESAAMNIVLKEKARLRIMTSGSAALGFPGLYQLTATSMFFRKQVKFINYSRFNNTGEDVSDMLFNHFALGYSNPSELLSINTGISPGLLKKRWLFNNAGVTNVNDLLNLKNDWQLRVNAHYLFDKQFQSSQSATNFFLGNDTIRFAEKLDGRKINHSLTTQFTLTANKKDYYLNNVTILENSNKQVFGDLQATAYNRISQQLSGNNTLIYNQFTLIKKTQKGKIWELYSIINNTSNPATLEVEPGLYASQFNNSNPYNALIQQAAIPGFYTDNHLGFGKVVKRIGQQYQIGANYEEQQLNSLLESLQKDGKRVAVADSFQNRLQWKRVKVYAKMQFTYATDRTTIRLSLPITFQDTKYQTRLLVNHRVDFPFTPDFFVKQLFGKENAIQISYKYGNTFGDINQVYDGYIMRNYRNFYANGNLLNQNNNHSFSAVYLVQNTLKIFFFSLGVGYNINGNSTINDTKISSQLQQTQKIPLYVVTRNTQLYASISKYIFPLQTTIGANLSWQWSNANQLQNGNLLLIDNSFFSAVAKINSKIATWLNTSYTGNFQTSNNQISGKIKSTSPGIENWLHNLEFNGNIGKNLIIKLNGELYKYKILGVIDNSYFLSDAGITYKLEKLKTDIELSLTNLANIENFSTASLTANQTSENSYLIRPRMALVKCYFRF